MIMTEEQIKQDAEAYACPENSYLSNMEKERVITHFIAGDHSRNEGIKELLKDRDRLQSEYNKLLRSYNEVESRCMSLKQELNQLRNPWINVEKQLPEEGTEVYVKFGETNINGIGYLSDDLWFVNGWGVTDVNYWMKIPDLKQK